MDMLQSSTRRTGLSPLIPEWVAGLVLPELENSGPEDILKAELAPLFHPIHNSVIRTEGSDFFDTGNRIKGFDYFHELIETGLIARCLNLDEGKELTASGVVQRLFPGKHPLLWRSTAYDNYKNLFVPWIQNIAGQHPVIYWWWLAYYLKETHCTPVFKI